MTVRKLRTRLVFLTSVAIFVLLILDISGILEKLHEIDFEEFSYPYEGDVGEFVKALRRGEQPRLLPLNVYRERFLFAPTISDCFVLFLVKSAVGNWERRREIRQTWGRNISTVFVVGVADRLNDDDVDKEIENYRDIIRLNVKDTYFNNTLKTINAVKYAATKTNCQFYVFLDDDMYISVKNLVRFLNDGNSTGPSAVLYAGNVELTYPRREKTSKWYVPISEYPYNKWPPFIPAGCFVLSREALQLIYYTSMYTKMFRFDDIFLSLVAYKAGIQMTDSEDFHMHTPVSTKVDFKRVIAFHGFPDPFKIWRQVNGVFN